MKGGRTRVLVGAAPADPQLRARLPRGDGGIIAIDTAGNFTMIFNSEGMYCGRGDVQGRTTVAIYRDSRD